MHSMLLTSDKDPMGAAIIDYLAHGKASKLRVFSSMFDEDEIPVNQLFRTFQEMPSLEQKALQLSTGKILDVGAGSGCHTLALQEMGKEVTAIDISPLSIEAMNKRGVKDARLQNFFDRSLTGPFDTILLLMNTGIWISPPRMIISERSISACNIKVSKGIHLIGYI